MRTLTFASILTIVLAACGGGDLTLPGPGEPATLRIVGGDGQRAEQGALVDRPLVVELLDGAGLPISGREVVFRFTDDLPEARVDLSGSTTDSLGRLSAQVRLGLQPGEQAIEASVATPGEDLSVRFELIADAADDGEEGGPDTPVPPTPPPPGEDPDGEGEGGGGEGGGEDGEGSDGGDGAGGVGDGGNGNGGNGNDGNGGNGSDGPGNEGGGGGDEDDDDDDDEERDD